MRQRGWRVVAGLLCGCLLSGGCADRAGLRDTPSLGVADTALDSGDPEFALRIAQRMIAADPGDAEAWAKQGDAYAAMGNPFQARGSYRRALALRPGSITAAMGMGRLALRDNPAEAANWFGQVLGRKGEQGPAAANDLGIALDLLGRHAAAQDSYRQALAMQPDLSDAQVNLGLSLALSGHARDGVMLIRPLAQGRSSTPKAREDLATALVLDGQDDAARGVLRRDVPPDRVESSMDALRRLRSSVSAGP